MGLCNRTVLANTEKPRDRQLSGSTTEPQAHLTPSRASARHHYRNLTLRLVDQFADLP